MRKLLFAVVGNSLVIWLTGLIVPEISVVPFAEGTVPQVLTFLLVALIFAVINVSFGTIIRILTFPLFVLTLGLFSLVVNALLLFIVSALSGLLGFGLQISGPFFWVGIWAALVFGAINWIIGLILRPIART